jgi:hypothetical protein
VVTIGDAVPESSPQPPRHPVLPGAVLALLVACGALVALAIAIDVGGGGPVHRLLGGADRDAISLVPPPEGAAGDRAGSAHRPGLPDPVALPLSGAPVRLAPVALGRPGAAAGGARRTAGLRGNARVRRRAGAPRAVSPSPAPVAVSTPAPATTSAPVTSTARPVATATPAPVVKPRGKAKAKAKVPKSRVKAPKAPKPGKPAPASAPAPAGPAAPAPPQAAPVGKPGKDKDKDKGGGRDDGVPKRVPPGQAKKP